jgi:hypothetical protein
VVAVSFYTSCSGVQASFGPINLMAFHEDKSVLSSHYVIPLKVASLSQSKKLICFSVFFHSFMSLLGQFTIQTQYETAYSFCSDRAKAFSVIIRVAQGKYQNGD